MQRVTHIENPKVIPSSFPFLSFLLAPLPLLLHLFRRIPQQEKGLITALLQYQSSKKRKRLPHSAMITCPFSLSISNFPLLLFSIIFICHLLSTTSLFLSPCSFSYDFISLHSLFMFFLFVPCPSSHSGRYRKNSLSSLLLPILQYLLLTSYLIHLILFPFLSFPLDKLMKCLARFSRNRREHGAGREHSRGGQAGGAGGHRGSSRVHRHHYRRR